MKKQYCIMLAEEIGRQIKEIAVSQDRSFSYVIGDGMKYYLDEINKLERKQNRRSK